MLFGKLSQNKTALSKVLENWIKNPNTELSEKFDQLDDLEVKTTDEAKLVCQALEVIQMKIQTNFNEKIENNIFNLTVLFQDASTKEASQYLDGNGIPILINILDTIRAKQYELRSYSSCETMILKIFALYRNNEGLNRLSELVANNFESDDYLWGVILNAVAEDEAKYSLVIKELNGNIPVGFLGISYLDMCNSIAVQTKKFTHPFDTEKGFAFLDHIVTNSSEDDESYVVSATASIPFLSGEYRQKLLKAVSNHSNIDVQIEAAWAGAKTGDQKSADKLIDFARDYRYSAKAVSYMEELNLDSKIPNEIKSDDFLALSEMCSWLSHPNEFGSYPDKAEIFDSRNIYWPPTKDHRTIYLVKYTYKNRNEDGSDEIGIGLVGSVTFSLFGLENLLNLKPVEVLAIHCNWELEKENYQDVKSGLDLLKKYNKNLE